MDISTLQEIRWRGKGTVFKKKHYMVLYSGHNSGKYEFGREFYIRRLIIDNL